MSSRDRLQEVAAEVERAARREVHSWASLLAETVREEIDYRARVGDLETISDLDEIISERMQTIVENALIPYAAHFLYAWGLDEADDYATEGDFRLTLERRAVANFQQALEDAFDEETRAVLRDYALDKGVLEE